MMVDAGESSTILGRGSRLVQGALEATPVMDALRAIERCYARIARAHSAGGLQAVAAVLGPYERFAPTASSVTISSALGERGTSDLIHALAGSRVVAWLEQALGGRVAADLDQSWVRRQYAPARYPPLHAPHAWHQDGALGFDFQASEPTRSAGGRLLPLVTCWMALASCGRDAPGLELVDCATRELLPPNALADSALRRRYPQDAFVCPELYAGDALLIAAGTIHRTHVTPSMRQDRTSLELRFVRADAIPSRLAGDRFVACDGGELRDLAKRR